jgi:hypothetical protein
MHFLSAEGKKGLFLDTEKRLRRLTTRLGPSHVEEGAQTPADAADKKHNNNG